MVDADKTCSIMKPEMVYFIFEMGDFIMKVIEKTKKIIKEHKSKIIRENYKVYYEKKLEWYGF